MNSIYDVIIVGGGISGTMAAAGALRNGAKTLLIEHYGFLGGMLTAAGVGPMMTFHAGDEQIIRGTTGELIDRLKAKGKSTGHQFDTTGFTYTVTPFDVEGMKRELEDMVTETGGEILYHTMLAGVEVKDGRIDSVTVCNKAGLSRLQAKIFVDATGDGDLSTWAGVDFTKGRESDGAAQPMTMKMRMLNVDMGKVRAYIKLHPEEFPRLNGDTAIIDKSTRLSIGGFVKTLEKAKALGDFSIPREDILFFEGNTPGEVIVNTSRIIGYDATDPWSLSKAETEGRKQSLELEKFLRKWIPGFEVSVLVYTGPQIGIRSSKQINGLYTLKAEDLLESKGFSDTIAHSGYPIDIHSPTGAGSFNRKLEWGTFYSIPYRCLVNGKIDNLITVGRCISASFGAQAAIRTTPTMGAVGQAGGVAASIAVKSGAGVQDIDVKLLQQELIRQGAYLKLPV